MRFYVYMLLDPATDEPFYVGKGQGRRAWQHTADVRKSRKAYNPRKHARIAQILAMGLAPKVEIVCRYADEMAAIEHEAELIAATTGLTNILARGSTGALTQEEAQRRLDERTLTKNRELLGKLLAMWDSWPNGVTFPNVRNGQVLAAELVAFVRSSLAQPNLKLGEIG